LISREVDSGFGLYFKVLRFGFIEFIGFFQQIGRDDDPKIAISATSDLGFALGGFHHVFDGILGFFFLIPGWQGIHCFFQGVQTVPHIFGNGNGYALGHFFSLFFSPSLTIPNDFTTKKKNQ
jgi:hypothetical protein